MNEPTGLSESESRPHRLRPWGGLTAWRSPLWALQYVRRLIWTDILSVAVAVIGAQIVWFGRDGEILGVNDYVAGISVSYFAVSLALIGLWLMFLAIFDTRDSRIVGLGASEYKRIGLSSLRLFGLVAIVSLLFKIDLARGYLILAFPAGLLLLLASRWLWRKWLVRQRQHGRFLARTILVGSVRSTAIVAEQLERFPHAGLSAIGVCLPRSSQPLDFHPDYPELPVLGSIDKIADLVTEHHASTVILSSSESLTSAQTRRISWSLEGSGVDLAVAPGLTDIAGPRIHTRPLAGLPLLHIEVPTYRASRRWVKWMFDFLGALFIMIVLSPVYLVLAVLVKTTSKGPVFFLQERVGLNGDHFRMVKFRTMVANAEDLLDQLEGHNEGAGLLFKIRDDPRVTRVGKWMRRLSLDELPQFFNVLRGEMSIVGPRPPLPSEVAKYEPHVHRRFLVRPGITGPWQISGRSDLSWDDGVRLDLYYVENWSLIGDFILIWRTIGAVLKQRGAY